VWQMDETPEDRRDRRLEEMGELFAAGLWPDLDAYLAEHRLPNERDYFDPAKADEKRECGLHAAWGKKAVNA